MYVWPLASIGYTFLYSYPNLSLRDRRRSLLRPLSSTSASPQSCFLASPTGVDSVDSPHHQLPAHTFLVQSVLPGTNTVTSEHWNALERSCAARGACCAGNFRELHGATGGGVRRCGVEWALPHISRAGDHWNNTTSGRLELWSLASVRLATAISASDDRPLLVGTASREWKLLNWLRW